MPTPNPALTTEQQMTAFLEQAGLLLDLPQGLANTATAQIAAVGAAYAARLASWSGDYVVDDIVGADTNPGTTALPLKTMQRAVALTPPGGRCIIRLNSAIPLNQDVVVNGQHVFVTSTSATRHVITPNRYQVTSVTPNQKKQFGFRFKGGSVQLYGVGLALTANDGNWPTYVANGHYPLFTPYDASNVMPYAVAINYCDLPWPAAPFGPLLWPDHPASLYMLNNTLNGGLTSLNGWLVHLTTNTAGTASTTLPWLRTNLATV